jgi:hypothetical protein
MPAKTYTVGLGVVLVLLGVAGLLMGDELLLGLVNIDVMEDLVHVVSGGLLLFAGLQRNASVTRGVVGVVSVVYLLVGVLGFVLPYLFGLLPHGYSVVDNLIHLVLSILGLLSTPTPGYRRPSGAPPTPAPDARVIMPLSVLDRWVIGCHAE